MSEDFEGEIRPCPDMERATATLQQVTLYALEDDDFRRQWDARVLEAVDKACADIAGQRLAGRTKGVTGPFYFEVIPVPDHLDAACVMAAFQLAILGEVSRRVTGMLSKSPGGVG